MRGASLPRQGWGSTAHRSAKQSRAQRLFTPWSSPAGKRPGSWNRLMRQTPPAPADNFGAAPFPQPRAEKLSVHLYGGRAGRWHCLRDCYGISLCLSFPERTCVRVLGECMDLCKSVCWCVCVSFAVPLLFRFLPALHRVRTPSSSQSRFSKWGKFSPERGCAGGRSSCTPSTTHPASPAPLLPLWPGSGSSVPTSSLRENSGSPALSGLPAPRSRLPPGRTWKSGAGRLKPRPPTQRGEWSAPHPQQPT